MPWWLWVLVLIGVADIAFVFGLIHASREQEPPSNVAEALRTLRELEDQAQEMKKRWTN